MSDSDIAAVDIAPTGIESCICRANYYRSLLDDDSTIPSGLQGQWVSSVRNYNSMVYIFVVARSAIGMMYTDYDSTTLLRFQTIAGDTNTQGEPVTSWSPSDLTRQRFQYIMDISLSVDGRNIWVADREHGIFQVVLTLGTLNNLQTRDTPTGTNNRTLDTTGTIIKRSSKRDVRSIWVNRLQTCVHYTKGRHVYMINLHDSTEHVVYTTTSLDEEIEKMVPSLSEAFSLVLVGDSAAMLRLYYMDMSAYHTSNTQVTLPDTVRNAWSLNAAGVVLQTHKETEFLTIVGTEVYILSILKQGTTWQANARSLEAKQLSGTVPVLVSSSYPNLAVLSVLEHTHETQPLRPGEEPTRFAVRRSKLGSVVRSYRWACSACPRGSTSHPGSNSEDACIVNVCPHDHWCSTGKTYPCPFGTISPANTFSQSGCRCVDGTRPGCANAFSYVCAVTAEKTQTLPTTPRILADWGNFITPGPLRKPTSQTSAADDTRYNGVDTFTSMVRAEIDSAAYLDGIRIVAGHAGLYLLDTLTHVLTKLHCRTCATNDGQTWEKSGCLGDNPRGLTVTGNGESRYVHFIQNRFSVYSYRVNMSHPTTVRKATNVQPIEEEFRSFMRWIDLSAPDNSNVFVLSVNGHVILFRPFAGGDEATVQDSDIRTLDDNLFAFDNEPTRFIVTSSISSTDFPRWKYFAFSWSRANLRIRIAGFNIPSSKQLTTGEQVGNVTTIEENEYQTTDWPVGVADASLTGMGTSGNQYLIAVTHQMIGYVFTVHHSNMSLSLAYMLSMSDDHPVETMWVNPFTHSISHISGPTSEAFFTSPSNVLYMESTWELFLGHCDPLRRADMFACNPDTSNESLPVECVPCNRSSEFGYLEECYSCPAGSVIYDGNNDTSGNNDTNRNHSK